MSRLLVIDVRPSGHLADFSDFAFFSTQFINYSYQSSVNSVWTHSFCTKHFSQQLAINVNHLFFRFTKNKFY